MSTKLRLSFAGWDYDRFRALQSGQVSTEGVELVPLVLPVEETFYRMLTYGEFDVAAFKERFGVSRKFAIPLLEYLDRERVTRRMGESRIVL